MILELFNFYESLINLFCIFYSAPYFSVSNLRINGLTTVLYDRQRLCQTIGLSVNQLPLLACLLGNDVVSEEKMQHIRNKAMTTYRCLCHLICVYPLHLHFLILFQINVWLTMFRYSSINAG